MSDAAVKTGVYVFLYFSLFVLLVAVADRLTAETYSFEDKYTSEELPLIYADKVCDSPRLRFNPVTGESKPQEINLALASLDCDNSQGVLSKDRCESIEGCDWDNVTINTWFFGLFGGETIASCEGTINASYYGIDVYDGAFGDTVDDFVSPFNFGGDNETSSNICIHPEVVQDKELCDLFSCTWREYDFNEEFKGGKGVISAITSVFTFTYDFGYNVDEDPMIVYILRFIFIILPLIIGVFAIYYIVNPLK
jgi:hypothetical protein